MKKVIQLTIAVTITIGFMACGSQTNKEESKEQKTEAVDVQSEKPAIAELHAYKAYHYARFMV